MQLTETFCIFVACVLATIAQVNGANNPTVKLDSGAEVRGIVNATTPSVHQFLSIPFAKPPIGPLRWAPPQKLESTPAVIDATVLGPSCPQGLSNGSSIYTRDVTQFSIDGPVSEDCLALSVWAPKTTPTEKELLPVLVFIYGGGFSTGGMNVPYQIPAQWVQRSQKHIVVSFNYRLNIFGFPNAAALTGSKSSINFGLLDQRLAIEWVHSNIASFGGDPSKITIWGQSAGAASVDYYNFAYPRDPLVRGLIMDSGTAFINLAQIVQSDTTGSNFTFVADHVGCANLSAAEELDCMRKVPAKVLTNFVQTYQDSGASPSLGFTTAPDGVTVFRNYTERYEQGLLADVPAIVGTNAQDGVAFAPYNATFGPDPRIAREELLVTFLCPAAETTTLRFRSNRPTFRYEYAGNFTNISPRFWMGAYHSSELPLLMGTHPDFRGPSTRFEFAVSEAMQDDWLAFITDPVRGLPERGWQAYTPKDGFGMELGAEGRVEKRFDVNKLDAACT